MFPAFFESGSQLSHDSVVIIEQISQQLTVGFFVFVGADGRMVVQDVKRSDVKLVHIKYRRIASDNKGKRSEPLNSVGDADRKFLPQISGTPLQRFNIKIDQEG